MNLSLKPEKNIECATRRHLMHHVMWNLTLVESFTMCPRCQSHLNITWVGKSLVVIHHEISNHKNQVQGMFENQT